MWSTYAWPTTRTTDTGGVKTGGAWLTVSAALQG